MSQNNPIKISILMVGPTPEAMGGISAVVKSYLGSDLVNKIKLVYLNTYVDGSKLVKLIAAIKALVGSPIICYFHRINIVHIHVASYSSFYRKSIIFCLLKIFKKKIVMHCHSGKLEEFHDANSINSFIIKIIFNASDVILVVSKRLKEIINGYTNNTSVVVLYNPVDSELLNGSISINGSKKTNTILFVGKVCENKGAYDILDAIPHIIRSCPNTKFIFAGDGELERARSIAQKTGLTSYVEFPGWVDGENKKKCFFDASIFLLPSYREGLPISILEAMAVGLPIVSTTVGGIPDAIEDGVNGFLVKPGDAEAIAEKVIYLLQDTVLREQMGCRNKTKAKEMFDIEKIVSQLMDIYSSMADSANPS